MARFLIQLTVLYAIVGISVSKSIHRRSIPDSWYLTLCIDDDGSVRNECIQKLSSSTNFLDAILSKVNEDKFDKNSGQQNTDLSSFLLKQSSLQEKRGGRDRSSGFYSNW